MAMDRQVEDLMERMRSGAHAQMTRPVDELSQSNGDSAAELDRLRANLLVARRAQDQLPPVKTYRQGLIARFELWIKRQLKGATRWFTWEQTNFNIATSASLDGILKLLAQLDNNIKDLRREIATGAASTEPDPANSALDTRLRAIEMKLQALLTQTEDWQSAQFDSLRDEQRVCFKQLAIQISEAAVVSDRAKRNLQMQLDQFARRLRELEKNEPVERDDSH
jgi:hypothetical protein